MTNEVDNPRRRGVSGAAKKQRELRDRLRERGSESPTTKPGGSTTITKDDTPPEEE